MVTFTRFPPPGTWRHVWDPPPSVAPPAPFGAPASFSDRVLASPPTQRLGVCAGQRIRWSTWSEPTHRDAQRALDLEQVARPAPPPAGSCERVGDAFDAVGELDERRRGGGEDGVLGFHRRQCGAAVRHVAATGRRTGARKPHRARASTTATVGRRAQPFRTCAASTTCARCCLDREQRGDEPVDAVRAILADVRERGDAALRELTARLDGVDRETSACSARSSMPRSRRRRAELVDALTAARDAIRGFHETQVRCRTATSATASWSTGDRCPSPAPVSTCPAVGAPTRRPC